MSDINSVFNNQVAINSATVSLVTQNLRQKIVKQLQGKSIREQEAIIEKLLKFLDVNLLAALSMAYDTPEDKEPAPTPDIPTFMQAVEGAIQTLAGGVTSMRTELLVVKSLLNEKGSTNGQEE